MTLEEYMRELVLMERQYGQEEELYPLINMLLRKNDNVRHLSVRDVHQSQSNGMKWKMLYGYCSFPDMVIMDEKLDFSRKSTINSYLDHIYGCVEAKIFNKNKKVPIASVIDHKKGIVNWTLEYPYVLLLKKQEKSWSNGYYTESKMSYGQKGKIEKESKEQSQNIKYYRIVGTQKKEITPKINDYDEYKFIRTITIAKDDDVITHKDIIQFLSELFWYGKVLYSDGLVWYYLELTEPSKKKIYSESEKLRKLLNVKNDGTREDKFVNAIDKNININSIEVLGVEIGNLKEIYDRVYKITKQEQRISVSAVGQHLTYEDRQEWERLKDNLARINWCGTNTLNQFRLKTEN